MDAHAVMAFNLIKKIDDEFKQFTGTRHAFARMVLLKYEIRVGFIKTPTGIAVSVDYTDMMQLFEKNLLPVLIKNRQTYTALG
jgi:hypothetical protein